MLAVWGLKTELTSHAAGITAPSWSWFGWSHSPGGSTGLIAGVVIATFLLGGWDSPIYLGDEQQRRRDPGRSVLISITFCLSKAVTRAPFFATRRESYSEGDERTEPARV